MKNNSPTHTFETRLATHHAAKKSLADSLALAESKGARFKELAAAGDLEDRAVIAELIELQMFNALFPTRIPALEQNVLDSENAALESVNDFIMEHLGPRSRALLAMTRASVAKQLSPLIGAGQSLDLAVTQSLPVRELERLSVPSQTVSQPCGGVGAHADRVLSAWNRLLELEAQPA